MAPSSTGFHHASLSVRDLGRSAEWYERVFRLSLLFEENGDERRARVYRLDGTTGMFGLVEHGGATDEGDEAHRWVEHLDDQRVEHSGLVEIPTGAICNFRDPDGIQLAIFWEKPT